MNLKYTVLLVIRFCRYHFMILLCMLCAHHTQLELLQSMQYNSHFNVILIKMTFHFDCFIATTFITRYILCIAPKAHSLRLLPKRAAKKANSFFTFGCTWKRTSFPISTMKLFNRDASALWINVVRFYHSSFLA